MLAARSSHPDSVNAAASPVNAAGSSRRWISADRLNGVVRCPHSNRSVCRRLAITTKPSRCAIRPSLHRTAVRLDGKDDLEQPDHLAALRDRQDARTPAAALPIVEAGWASASPCRGPRRSAPGPKGYGSYTIYRHERRLVVSASNATDSAEGEDRIIVTGDHLS